MAELRRRFIDLRVHSDLEASTFNDKGRLTSRPLRIGIGAFGLRFQWDFIP